ncbi:MAG: AEC family transporter [Dermatophilaceae bacterium]
MLGALEGFATIGAVVLVGWLVAHLRLFDERGQRMLADLAFFVASPALLLVVLSGMSTSAVFSPVLLVAFLSALTVMLAAALTSRFAWGEAAGDRVMGALCAGYVNSGNLGLPIALYVLGDIAYAAPILLMQLLIFTPVSMAMLDADSRAGRSTVLVHLRSLFRNPITVGALLGLLLSVTGLQLPQVVLNPLTLLGNMAVPGMLLAFGISLRLGQRPGQGRDRIAVLVALKLLVQPLVAAGLGVAFGLRGQQLYAVVVMATLPTAQNIFTYALRYRRSIFLTRDVILVSTLLSLPAILLIAALLAPR